MLNRPHGSEFFHSLKEMDLPEQNSLLMGDQIVWCEPVDMEMANWLSLAMRSTSSLGRNDFPAYRRDVCDWADLGVTSERMDEFLDRFQDMRDAVGQMN